MKKTKVLYIEDEASLGRIVKESLESRDFTVNMGTDGQDVSAAFLRTRPDICILDIMLPGKDGYAVAREIRGINPNTPIIFLTAKTQTGDIVKGFEAGGNDYIRKPFSMEELIVRIGNLLELTKSREAPAPDVIRIGKYCFYPLRYELKKDGDNTHKLSYRESSLLMTLAENRNTIVKRTDILRSIWGDDSYFNSRTLDVYITKLRSYFKQDPAIRIITIKGVGYHFSVEG